MENAFAKVEELASSIKEYADTRIESAKLTVAEKSSALLASLIAGIFVVSVFVLFVVFCSVALALGLGNWLQNTWAGFLIVGFCYLLIGIIVWLAKVKIIQLPIMNTFIKQLFTKEDETN
jgi:protein-S-isoprenylcysteine O-methyltransferase Ste14